ncbi:MAG: Holliday junction resolvase RuvX [Clostridia bacterium]|nr:Holliday junction resolvase RuvX [Clostridia bacterium]
MRVMGIDYGDARVGVAVSDLLGLTSQGVGTVKNTGFKKLMAELKEIIDEYEPEVIVIGLPKNMDGTEGFRAEATYKFADRLRDIYSGRIELCDERLTTMGAARFLNMTDTRGKKRKNVIDTVSACLILDSWLAKNKG